MEEKTKRAIAGIKEGLLFLGTFGSFVTGLKIMWEGVIVKMMSIPLSIIGSVFFFALGVILLKYWIAQQKGPLQLELEEKTKQYDELVKECRNEEEVSKELFDELKTITLSFGKLFDAGTNPLAGFLGEIYRRNLPLLEVQTKLKGYISRSFGHYQKLLKKFDGTMENFILLIDEFENAFFAYEDLFVKPLVNQRGSIVRNRLFKEKFNKFAAEYEHRRRQYIDYGEKVNRLLNSNVIRTDFDSVGTL